MYYELYLDVFFLVNFLMDYILLLLVRKMLRSTATHRNIFLGAIVGALLTCIVIILPIKSEFWKYIIFHLLVNTCMIRVGLKVRGIRGFGKAMILLYISAILVGGILESVSQYVKAASLFLFFAIGGYYSALFLWNFIEQLLRWNQYHCRLEIFVGEKHYEANGMIDTGNSLYDPITGRPVSILKKELGEQILKETKRELIYVPYKSIGKEAGVLRAFSVDKICIYQKNAQWIDNPLFGISEEKIHECILHPSLF